MPADPLALGSERALPRRLFFCLRRGILVWPEPPVERRAFVRESHED